VHDGRTGLYSGRMGSQWRASLVRGLRRGQAGKQVPRHPV